MKKSACLLLCLLLCLPLAGWAEENDLRVEAVPHSVRYSFDLPDTAFAYVQYDSHNDGGNFVLYSADGHFEGECTLPGAAEDTRMGLNVSTLSGHQLAQVRLVVPGDPEEKGPAANLPAAETTARAQEVSIAADGAGIRYSFRAPGRDSVILKCRSPQEWHQMLLYAGENYRYEGYVAMPASYPDDILTVTISSPSTGSLLYDENILMPYTAPELPTEMTSRELKGVVVCVDPGHQRTSQVETVQAGPNFRSTKTTQIGMAKGIVTKRMESQVVLEISMQLRNRLMEMGAAVVTTREMQDTFVGMLERADIPNCAEADFVLRLHCNSRSGDPSIQGLEVYCPLSSSYARATADTAEYTALGETLLNAMKDATGMRKGNCKLNDNYVGNNWSMMPSFLVEMGYMTNMEEDLLLSNPEYQRRLVEGMAQGIVQMARMRGLIDK